MEKRIEEKMIHIFKARILQAKEYEDYDTAGAWETALDVVRYALEGNVERLEGYDYLPAPDDEEE